jgi:hypothetical protein
LACIIGKSREIFFPKFVHHDMINFVEFLEPLLHEHGYVPHYFASEKEAKASMHIIKEKKYPVYLFSTDTSGEKLYEEFYTETEIYDIQKFNALGVISKSSDTKLSDYRNIINELESLLSMSNISKAQIVNWLNKYITDFKHIETGLGLDEKM